MRILMEPARMGYWTAGNVDEWTRSKWGTGWSYEFALPYDAEDGRENLADLPDDMKFVVRGGSWDMTKVTATVFAREGLDLNSKNHRTGFRLVMQKNVGG
ncbi:MAG: SUMF1/EgtB/PvdO family nonheme iron enzyme [Chloroflexi bacterium]|nr:SUMF1/EgtB/PvdO family nonheme iron enzyme [Chloroflexota bacterium]